MAAVPLLQESPGKKSVRSEFSRWTNFLSSTIVGKDELTVACEKAASTHTASYSPKEKHLDFLLRKVDENPATAEEVLLRFTALTKWAEDPVVAIKVLSCTHQIMRKVPVALLQKQESFIIFLSEIRNHWSIHQVAFVDLYASALMHHAMITRHHYQLFENTFSRGAGMSMGITFFDQDEIVHFVTKLLSYQDRLLGLIRLPSFPSSSSPKNAAIARHAACSVIIEQCKQLLSVTFYLVVHLETPMNNKQPDEDNKLQISILREQMEEQERFLRSAEREFS